MTQKTNNQVVIAFFGSKIRKEPFLIDNDTPLGAQQEKLKDTGKPQVLENAMKETVFGETFNKILPEMEPYLKSVFDNRNSKIRREAAIDLTAENLEINISNKNTPKNSQDLQQSIDMKMKQQMKMKPKPKR